MPRGLQAEVLVSLSIVMLTATGILGIVLEATHERHVHQLRELAARSLVAEARSPLDPTVPGAHWWQVEASGSVRPRGGHAVPIDPPSRALAGESRARGAVLLRAGRVWQPIRIAVPLGAGGTVAVARLQAQVSPLVVPGVLLVDAVVFTAFGAYLLRRRLVRPLQSLASAAREIADGGLDVRAPVGGVRETSEVGAAFNEMTEALEGRSRALEKAVASLRESNRSLRAARAGLDRAERLASVGRLAAGVAHEVGNPMGAMLAFLDLVKRDEQLADSSREYLSRAAKQGERVRTILHQLLDFSRPPRAARVPVELGALCAEAAELVRAQRRYAPIDIEVETRGDPPPARADPGGVSQILLNLLLNAADACVEHAAEPRIRVVVQPATVASRHGEDPGAASGRRCFDAVECRVEDNGAGVPSEDRERIFDPFFSTKSPGEGTGLGLPNAARFAEEFGGSLTLDAAAGSGAAFVLRLPVATEDSSRGEVRSRV